MSKIAVIGVGKVGLPLASYFRELDHEVAVYDKSVKLLDQIASGQTPLPWEAGIRLDLCVCRSMAEVIDWQPDVIFVVTPTPQIGSALSSGPVIEVLAGMDALLSRKHDRGLLSPYKQSLLVSVVSTLDPRDAAQVCSGWRHLRIVYNPPLIRLGSVVRDLREATIRFLGGDVDDCAKVERCYDPSSKAHRISGEVVSIACAKLAINATLSARAAWGNDLADRARQAGADVAVVFAALDAEPRIGGTSYMLPGPPPGGPCLPRDMEVWEALGAKWGSGLVEAVQRAHDVAEQRLVAQALGFIEGESGSPCVAVLGLGYKPGGLDVTRSIGVAVARSLVGSGCEVFAADPVVGGLVRDAVLLPGVEVLDDPMEATRAADFVIVCLATEQNLEAAQAVPAERRLVLDFQRPGSEHPASARSVIFRSPR